MTYWRALKTLRAFQIIEGTFYEHAQSMRFMEAAAPCTSLSL